MGQMSSIINLYVLVWSALTAPVGMNTYKQNITAHIRYKTNLLANIVAFVVKFCIRVFTS